MDEKLLFKKVNAFQTSHHAIIPIELATDTFFLDCSFSSEL